MNFYKFLYFWFIVEVNAYRLIFKNLTCESLDKSFVDFRQCLFQTTAPGEIELSIHCEIYQVPVKDVTTNVAVYKYDSGYKPYHYNITWDFCAFMKNRKRMPLLAGIGDSLVKYSNINHTCPYAQDIVIRKWVLKEEYFSTFPLPAGNYMVVLKVAVYDDWKAVARVFITRS